MEKLRYRIVHCSGSDLQYPHTELIQISQDSKGWQTPRFCTYPQQLIVQFYSPVRLRQIQILSHEFKITSKIEVSVYIPDVRAPIPQQNPKYIKVGYMTLNSNEKSNYKQRELKSAYLDTAAVQLKLEFHKNFPNKQNVFNQIGILMLNFFGELLISDPYQRSETTNNEVVVQTSLEKQKLKIDSITADRIKVLETAKEKAVMNEDYEVAKKLKNAIDKMKQIGILIYQLEEKKAVAVSSEDYESARLIQAELQMLKNAIQPELMFNKNPQGDLPTINKGYYDESKKGQMVDSILEEEQDQEPEDFDQNAKMQEQKEYIPFDERPLPALANKQKNVDLENGEEQNKEQGEEGTGGQNQKDQNEEGENQNNENEDGAQEEKIEPSKLSQENEKIMELVTQVLPQENIIQIFSKKWQTRDETLKSIEEELKNPKNLKGDQQIQFHAFMCIVSLTIAQNIIPIYQTSLSLFHLVLSKYNSKITPKSEFPRYLNTIFDNLLQKLAETNQRIKEQAENTLLEMCKHPSITSSVTVTHLIKAEKGPKASTFHKNIAAKIDLLTKIVKTYKINNNEVPLNSVMDYLTKHIGHQNNDVRIKALDLFFDIYRIIGEAKFAPFVEELLPNQKEIVQTEIDNIKGGGQGGTYKEVHKLDIKKVQGTFKKSMQQQQQQTKQKQEEFQKLKQEKAAAAAAQKNQKKQSKFAASADKKESKKDSKKVAKIQEEDEQS